MKTLPCKLGDRLDRVHYCPACKESHTITTMNPRRAEGGAQWTFDGNEEAPTFNPSIRVSWGRSGEDGRERVCHYFIRSGMIEYCSDSTHALAGQTVPLPDLPEDEIDFWSDRRVEL